jgi:hypothetical protein
VATPRAGTITIDGALGDAGWQGARWHDGFVERKPGLGGAPPVPTRFRVVYDRSFLYVAVFCGEPIAADIVARTTTRDAFAIFNDDAISVKIDAQHDQRTTVGLVLNPAGARLDYRGVNEASMMREWDTVWTGAAARVEGGWGAEFRVAWSALGVDPDAPPRRIGLNFSRDHARRNATYDWALMPPPYSPISASRYGHLGGLEALARLADAATATASDDGAHDSDLRVLPWVLGGAGYHGGAQGGRGDAGVDLFVRRGSYRGQLTVNTDFAQADVDDAIVNLDRFSLQMPEKRAFFLRDVERFAFGRSDGVLAFYSRRIGLDRGERVPILAGVKAVGDPSERVRFAALDVVTRAADGLPPTNHSALRAQLELEGGSNVGAIWTHRQSLRDPSDANTVVGVDGALRGGRQPLLVEAFAALARTGAGATVATSDVGAAAGSQAGADGEARAMLAGTAGVSASWRGRLVRPTLRYLWVGEGMRTDLGFLRRVGVHDTDATLVVEPRFASYGLERLRLEATGGAVFGAVDGALLDADASAGFDLIWNDGWLVGAEFERLRETVQFDFTAAGIDVPAATYDMNRWLVGGSTPSVRAASGWLDVQGRDWYGGDALQAAAGLTLRPGTWLRLETSGVLARLRRAGERALVALLNSRASIGFSPDLNVDLYAGYSRLDRRVPWMARLRWTWRRGSDVFFVVQGNLVEGGPLDVDALLKATWALP